MLSKVLKVFAILLLVVMLLVGGVLLWVNSHKDELFRKIQSQLNESISGQLEVGDYAFTPLKDGAGFTFSLLNVRLVDSLIQQHQTPLLRAQRVRVVLNLLPVLVGEVRIQSLEVEEGELSIFVRTDGYSNLSLFRSSGDTTRQRSSDFNANFINRIKRLRFDNFRVSYADSLKGKSYAARLHSVTNRVNRTDQGWEARWQGTIFFEQLLFNPSKGGFLTQQETYTDLRLAYDPDQNRFELLAPSVLQIATKEKIGIEGYFDLSTKPGQMDLRFTVEDMPVPRALELLPEVLCEKIRAVGILPVVQARVEVKGAMSVDTPRVHVRFKTEPFEYSLALGTFKKMRAEGTFTNQLNPNLPAGNKNSSIVGTRVKGYFESIPLYGNLIISNLANPKTILRCAIHADSSSLSALLDPERYRVNKGTAHIDFYYNGSLRAFYTPGRNRLNGSVDGKLRLRNLGVSYLPQKVGISDINGDITFNENVFLIPKLTLSDGQNRMTVTGKSTGLLLALFGSEQPAKAAVQLKIPDWQLNWLAVLLNPQTPRPQSRKNFKLSELLDNTIENLELKASIESNRVRYRRFTGTNVRGNLTVTNRMVSLDNFSLNAFRGKIQVSGNLTHRSSEGLPRFHAQGRLINADVRSVFYSFANFGQKAVTDQNLKGTLNSDFTFQSQLTNAAAPVPASMQGKLAINLTNGQIIQFEPFLKIKRLVFKNRDFGHVRLAPIRQEFTLKGQEITVKQMQIESNVLTLFVDGIYSFGDKTDLSIQIPLSNLKRRDSSYEFQMADADTLRGRNIFLRARDENGEVNIKYDPIKRFRKK